jgi:hypothetical protein
LPFQAKEENCPKLEVWILDYYKDSMFNVCEHQPLPRMEGPPVHFKMTENTTPVAVHTPITVPLHWQDEVKAGLDSDIALGVREPVLVGEHVTWCSRMVITRKKDSGPRRVVDYQAVNKHCSRETPHDDTIPSVNPVPAPHQEVSDRCMERVPCCGNSQGGPSCNNIHHTMGMIQVHYPAPGVHRCW